MATETFIKDLTELYLMKNKVFVYSINERKLRCRKKRFRKQINGSN